MVRLAARTAQHVLDLLILSAAYWAAFLLRFDGHIPYLMIKRLAFTWPHVVAFEFFVLSLFAVPRFAWRYIGLREASRVFSALCVVSFVLLVARVISAHYEPRWGYVHYALVPIGVTAANLAFAFLGVTGIRVARRLLSEHSSSARLMKSGIERVPTLLLGAGKGGMLVAREISARPDLGIDPRGFLDDDPSKIGTIIHGIPVVGRMDQLPELAWRLGAKQAIVTVADARRGVIRRIVELCKVASLPVKIVPGLYELLDGKLSLAQIRDVSIEDLLGRDPVTLDTNAINEFLRGKRVLLTGAGGSIGSELCRQVARFSPSRLYLVERSEFALFLIHQELSREFPGLDVTPWICDICDEARVDAIFSEAKPDVVFHAAAHKHVPMVEWNPGEAVKNNVFGTKTIADAAHRHGVGTFVMISTDKAVNPTSIMGATKRVAEMYIQALSTSSKTKYVAVRFGNVLGSTGSVIPTFKAQIAAGGPLTVTHPEMKRYFMTIPEASQLVLQAASMGAGGEIFVLDMGEPVKIVDLAHELIRLSGFVPNVDIKIDFTGVRPGEKLFEELAFDAEKMSKTKHPKIFIGKLAAVHLAQLETDMNDLRRQVGSMSAGEVRAALREFVPEMLPPAAAPVNSPQNADGARQPAAPANARAPELSPA